MNQPKRKKRVGVRAHTVRTKDGGTRTFKKFTRSMAMAAFCTECLGHEEDPQDCTSPLCPLFPWRRRTQSTNKGDKK